MRSLILASGTLSPMDMYEDDLGMKFEVKLQNKHVIEPEQALLRIVKSYQSNPFVFDYQSRQNKTMMLHLGAFIEDVSANLIRGGMLVFFPSYAMLVACRKAWENKKDGIKFRVPIQYEPKQATQLESVMAKHRANCGDGNVSILVGVCRGKLSEGYDYPDDLARAVMVIGVPFQNTRDLKSIIKRTYYVRDPNKWLKDRTMGAVNQSLGRVIRHRADYGAMYLVDLRYSQREYKPYHQEEAEARAAGNTEAEAVEDALNDDGEIAEEGESPDEPKQLNEEEQEEAEMINPVAEANPQNSYKDSAFNEFTQRLSNWISDRLEPASLLDYGKVNLMQNRYELRMFLETNHKRYLKAMEDQKIQQAAENRKEDETESDELSGSDLSSDESDEEGEDDKGNKIVKRKKDKKSAAPVEPPKPSGFSFKNWAKPSMGNVHNDYDRYEANIDTMGTHEPQTTEILDVGPSTTDKSPGVVNGFEIVRGKQKSRKKPTDRLQTTIAFPKNLPPQKRTHEQAFLK